MIEKMAAHHRNELYLRLERVNDIGVAEIRKAELMHWYQAERLTSKVWSDIDDKWAEVNDEGIPLLIGDADGVWVFAYGKGLTASDDAWLKPVSSKIK